MITVQYGKKIYQADYLAWVHNSSSSVSVAPSWAVKIDGLLASVIKGYEKFAPLYAFHFCASTLSRLDIIDAGVFLEKILLVIPLSSEFANLFQSLTSRKTINVIEVVELISINGSLQKQSIFTFSKCMIDHLELRGGGKELTLLCSYAKCNVQQYQWNNDGRKSGSTTCSHDLRIGKAKAKTS